ncbi:hypothetical protein BS78_04G120600 [Paspalum vaginatum]|nr:hypothetical protein BS78_04G120600 [Paspalum vaginatum]
MASRAKQKRKPKQSPGNTCHQCRQQTTDFPRDCKGYRTKGREGPCTIRYCGRCLLNRYGKEEELVPMEGWICPKCRGICNCSVCRKKKGEMPTGALAHVAKTTGCTSVHDLLQKLPETVAAVQALRSSSPKQSQKRNKGTNASAIEFQDQWPENMGADFIVPRKKRTRRSYSLNNNSVDGRSPLQREESPNGPYNTNGLPLTNSYPSPNIGAHVEDEGNVYGAARAALWAL